MSKHFRYSGFDEFGNKVQNTLTASSYDEAHNEASQRVNVLIELEAISAKSLGVLPAKLRLTLEEKALFFSELALLLESGIVVSKALSLLALSLKEYPKLASALRIIAQDLESGQSFSESLEQFPLSFDEISVGLIRVSENTGNMSVILNDLSDYYHFNLENKRKITQSMTYPAVVFSVSLLAIYIILDFVLPNMTSIFKSSDDVPLYTQVLLDVSAGFQNYKAWILSGMAALFTATYLDIKVKGTDSVAIKTVMKIPMFNGLIAKFELIRFHSTMQVMLAAGIPINRAIELARDIVLTKKFRNQLSKVSRDIAQGSSFSSSMEKTSSLNALSIGLIEVAEHTGNLDKVFSKLAEREKIELNTRLERFIALLEPLLIVFLGGFIGSVVVVMILSIMSTQNVAL